jgi:hypothetical protein
VPDPVSAAAAKAVVKGAAKAVAKEKQPGLIKRVLGPPADAIGEQLATYVKFRGDNAMQILENAAAKANLDESGSVPPRVAWTILNDGSWCDDPVMVEYLGGALASARTGGRDDRSARWASLVTHMSAYEIRAHYIVYRAIREVHRGGRDTLPDSHGGLAYQHISQIPILMDLSDFASAMEFTEGENPDLLLAHAVQGLRRENLVRKISYCDADASDRKYVDDAPFSDASISVIPSLDGAELYLFAFGQSHRDALELVSEDWSDEVGVEGARVPRTQSQRAMRTKLFGRPRPY